MAGATWAAQWLASLSARLTESVGDNQPYEIEQHIDYTLPSVGDNQPYEIEQHIDYTLPVHSEARQIPGIMLEIRQDKLQHHDAVQRWSELIDQCWLSMA
jgi:predicted N-formylglutamate amidohydrolase